MITFRQTSNIIISLVYLSFLTHPAAFSYQEGIKSTLLKKTTTATNGQKLSYLQTDSPEVTATIVEIPPGAETGWHLHTVPVYGYVLGGRLMFEFKNGKQYIFTEGDPIIEVVNTPHNGRNIGKTPVKLVVFYTGAEGKPNTVEVQSNE